MLPPETAPAARVSPSCRSAPSNGPRWSHASRAFAQLPFRTVER